MLIKFKSKASGDVIMLGESGREMLRLLGKDADDSKGIFSIDQLPVAIATLKQAVADNRAVAEPSEIEHPVDSTYDVGESIHLYQRAVPVLEILERSLHEKTYVTWGV